MDPHPLDAPTPAATLLGRTVLSVDAAVGAVRVGFTARPEFLNRHGTVQGGFLAAMLDSTTAIAVLATLAEDETVLTTDLRVSYERPANQGALTGVGRMVARDGREARSEGELLDGDGRVVARAAASLRIVAPR